MIDDNKLIGLNQTGFNSENTINSEFRVQRYKTKPNKVTSIASGSLIFSSGIGIALSIEAFDMINRSNRFSMNILYNTNSGIKGIFDLILIIGFFVIIDPTRTIPSLIVGFFIGGFLSSVFYKKEGKRGPIYSIYLSLSFTTSLAFIYGISMLNNSNLGSLSGVFEIFTGLILIGLVTTVVGIPMAGVAWIGYKMGLYFNRI